MRLTEKLRGGIQKLGGSLILASVYGISAQAQQNSVDLDVGSIKAVPMLGESDLTSFLNNAVNIILIMAGIAAVGYLIFGGITYITAGGDSERAGKGRTMIMNAIIGVIIIIGSLALYNTVINLGGNGTL